MPLSRHVIVFLLAAALAGCSETSEPGNGGSGGAGGTGGGSAGSGGSGGSGGTGGSGGGSTVDCGGVRVLELDGSVSPAVLTDSTDGLDNWVGSCTPEDTVGTDVVVHFRAGETGFYNFSTQGTEMDTVLYALRDCNDGFTEAACNDDRGTEKYSQISLHLEAGDELFVVVDSIGPRNSQPFTLTARKVEAAPPVIDEIAAFYNGNFATAGVRLTGRNPDSPLVGYELRVFAADGTPFAPLATRFDDARYPFFTVTQGDGTFVVEGSFGFTGAAPAVGRIEMVLVDEFDLVSDPAGANTAAPPVIGRGEPCDRLRARNECGPNDACVMRGDATIYTCEIATAPTIGSATATINAEKGIWGLVIQGSDPESDVLYARLLPKNASGAVIPSGGTPTLVPFHQAGHDGTDFRGVVAISTGTTCLPPAQAYYDACVRNCTTQACADACLAQAQARLDGCRDTMHSSIASVDVQLVDETSRVSSTINVPVTATPAVERGGICDPYGAIGICPEGDICWSSDDYQPETCQENGPTSCPSTYAVIDQSAFDTPTARKWVYNGDNSESASYEGGSCGGGGPADVFAFTATNAGTYNIVTSNLAPGVDTVVYVRTWCQLPAYERACSDDFLGNPTSRVGVSLQAGETVYIFVDSVDASAAGAYTLTITGP